MDQINCDALKRLASKYIWWKTPEDAVVMPERIIAQVMNIGGYTDVQVLASQVGDEVLTHAEAEQFSERSWAYWHYRLGLACVDQVPVLPARRFVGDGDLHILTQDEKNTLVNAVSAVRALPEVAILSTQLSSNFMNI